MLALEVYKGACKRNCIMFFSYKSLILPAQTQAPSAEVGPDLLLEKEVKTQEAYFLNHDTKQNYQTEVRPYFFGILGDRRDGWV